jgi:hypothetical protein
MTPMTPINETLGSTIHVEAEEGYAFIKMKPVIMFAGINQTLK